MIKNQSAFRILLLIIHKTVRNQTDEKQKTILRQFFSFSNFKLLEF